jgi:hypothetical protein
MSVSPLAIGDLELNLRQEYTNINIGQEEKIKLQTAF